MTNTEESSLPGTEPRAARASAAARPIRVGVLCDFLEERWPSMDVVGEMISIHLAGVWSGRLSATRLVPQFHRRAMRMPGLGAKLAWNSDRFVNRFVDYPRWLRAQSAHYDLFHVVDHSYSQLLHVLPQGTAVVTCHDLDTFRCVLEPRVEPRPFWFRAMTRRILDGFLKAAHVLAVSEATRDQLLRYGLFPEPKITVVHNGVHRSFSAAPDPASDQSLAAMLPAAPGGERYLLNVGSSSPRKRLDVLLRVFAGVRRQMPAARLLRVGELTAEQQSLAESLGIAESIVALPFLEREVLAACYRRADLLLHTAEAEGFGLPLVEAMACGCPVVASDLPVLREVGKAEATYCPVGDVEAWTKSVIGLLQEKAVQPRLWEARREQALAQSAGFSWERNAGQTAAIYEEVWRGASRAWNNNTEGQMK